MLLVVRDTYNSSAGQSPGFDLLFELLDKVMQANETTYIIIDGLDEAPERLHLLSRLRDLCEISADQSLHVLLSKPPRV